MAQWILEDPERVNVRGADEALYDSNGRKISSGARRVYAQFQRGGLPDYALEVARSSYGWKKMPDGVEIQNFAGFYDSEVDQIRMGWTDEERAEIESKLAGYAIPVGRPDPVAPWPKYASVKPGGRGVTWQTIAERHIETAEATGVAVEALLAYERATRAQDELIAAYEAFLAASTEAPAEESRPLIEA